jgi:hypothetical protein
LFRTDGDTPSTRSALDAARRVNTHVVKYLVDARAVPFDQPSHFVPGSKDEAVYVAQALGPAYSTTAGVMSWLRFRSRKRRR